jgi:hypothetical protein
VAEVVATSLGNLNAVEKKQFVSTIFNKTRCLETMDTVELLQQLLDDAIDAGESESTRREREHTQRARAHAESESTR